MRHWYKWYSKIKNGIFIENDNTIETAESDVDKSLKRLQSICDEESPSTSVDELLSLIKSVQPVLKATTELRRQHSLRTHSQKNEFPGLRSGADPFQYLEERFGDAIKNGEFGTGQLLRREPRLFSAIQLRLSKMEGEPTITEYFRNLRYSLSENVGQNAAQSRLKSCALLLGTDEMTAAKFFSGIRPDRVRSSGGGGIR